MKEINLWKEFEKSEELAEKSYFNTTNESGTELKELKKKASTQDKVILRHFTDLNTFAYSPSQVHMMLGLKCPITSTRRSFSNLTKKGLLVKTDLKVKGIYGRNEYQWKLCKELS